MIRKGDVQLGMSLTDFNNTMYWGTWAESDPGQVSWGGSGYDRYFQDHLIVYGGDRERIFIFDNRSVLVAITESIEEAKKLILRARATSSSIQNLQAKPATRPSRAPDLSGLDSDTRSSIGVACVTAKSEGPARYYECVNAQLASIGLNTNQVASGEPKKISQQQVNQDSERVKALEQRLAKLEAEKNTKQQAIAQDTQNPVIRIIKVTSDDAKGVISGVATDNTGVAEIRVDGEVVPSDRSGRFTSNIFIPFEGKSVEVVAYDLNGLSTTETMRLERSKRTQQGSRLAAVNPLIGPKQKPSRDRAALIIGLEKYARAPTADFAARDAQMFADYAREKLGVPNNNIKVLTDSEAEETAILRALKVWLPKAVKPDTTDLYVFYAGHGMPTADGTSAYLVPYDGDIQLLEDTAISRKRFFDEISASKPRSATFFFDNCYSGATRSEQQLLAARPLTIKVEETEVPDNYLVFTAGETDQIAGVELEVKHGRFSYFVFKGLEGEADANLDGKISAGELHQYVRESVGRFSAGAQTPTMLGDAGRWVLR
ncbi:MAG: hypothetical protein CMD66_01700 [Gammaproteobacteria bacterium]|nr:hypothetical protein [Gammaproteobacteria bacterium]